MLLTIHNAQPISDPTNRQIVQALNRLKIAGRHQFAILEDTNANYVQVGGGASSCTLEKRTKEPLKHFRAHQDKPRPGVPDGTQIAFAGGSIPLISNEWLTIDQAIEVFLAFRNDTDEPQWLHWRDISDTLGLTQTPA